MGALRAARVRKTGTTHLPEAGRSVNARYRMGTSYFCFEDPRFEELLISEYSTRSG